MRRALPLALAISLGACVAGPPPQVATPTPDLPEAYFFKADPALSASLAALLPSDDAAFVDLADAALEGAPSLAEALARVEAARAGARQGFGKAGSAFERGISEIDKSGVIAR